VKGNEGPLFAKSDTVCISLELRRRQASSRNDDGQFTRNIGYCKLDGLKPWIMNKGRLACTRNIGDFQAMPNSKQSLKVLACEVAQREICHMVSRSRHLIDLEFLPIGYHDDPKSGHSNLQLRIDSVESGRYDAILLGYGLCNRILAGITSRELPLVIPRAHDCLTFFLGSRQRQAEVHHSCPGTFYFTSGWLEVAQRRTLASKGPEAMRKVSDDVTTQPTFLPAQPTFEELAAKYGEDNARYLVDLTQQWSQSYERGLLIDFDFAASLDLCERTASICKQRGWRFERMPGDLGLLERWLDGRWDPKEFLIVQPSEKVYPTADDDVMASSGNRNAESL